MKGFLYRRRAPLSPIITPPQEPLEGPNYSSVTHDQPHIQKREREKRQMETERMEPSRW